MVLFGKWRWISVAAVLSEVKKSNENYSRVDLRGNSSLYTLIYERTCPFVFANEDEKVKSFFGKANKSDIRKKIAFTLIWTQVVFTTAAICFIV